jgi:hypothetical protein
MGLPIMPLSLEEYCKKYGYTLIEKYITLEDEKGFHERAKVRHNKTEEIHYLYRFQTKRG